MLATNRGYGEAKDLTSDDEIKVLTLEAPATHADWRLPVATDVAAYAGTDRRRVERLVLPEKWSAELGHYVGWLVGDGCISGDVVTTVYGSDDDRDEQLPY